MLFEVEYGGSTHKAAAGLNALVIYEQEFNSDLIKDVFGIVEVTEEDLVESKSKDDVVFRLDYTKTNWTKIAKAIWACLKNHDDTIPSFTSWAKQIDDMNLIEAQNAAILAFNEVFFPTRNGDAEKEADNK